MIFESPIYNVAEPSANMVVIVKLETGKHLMYGPFSQQVADLHVESAKKMLLVEAVVVTSFEQILKDAAEQVPTITTRRQCPGRYEVTDGTRTVSVIQNKQLDGPAKWIAAAQWDRYLLTDPMMTLRDAKFQARLMLEDAQK